MLKLNEMMDMSLMAHIRFKNLFKIQMFNGDK